VPKTPAIRDRHHDQDLVRAMAVGNPPDQLFPNTGVTHLICREH
jgi:hypothetical protein